MFYNQLLLFKTLGIILAFVFSNTNVIAQDFPSFGPEIQVTISGLATNSMEPFISPDGSYLFFNNLNDGINTRLYYAERVNDSTFTFIGELNGTNQENNPQLNAVASLDTTNNFYWVSLRDYPLEFDNLFHGEYENGNVTNIGRLHGDFYIYNPGWILMDHGISYDGQLLYFNNARFEDCPGPCETRIGVAQKENDSTFTMLTNSSEILATVNKPNYKNYAPAITSDELELYYTRFLKGPITANSIAEICVVVRNSPTDTFSAPEVLFSELIVTDFVEAPTLTTDKQIMYYHKKVNGLHKIMMRYRQIVDGVEVNEIEKPALVISPNPMNNRTTITIDHSNSRKFSIVLLDSSGRIIRTYSAIPNNKIDIYKNNLRPGLYFVQLMRDSKSVASYKLIVE